MGLSGKSSLFRGFLHSGPPIALDTSSSRLPSGLVSVFLHVEGDSHGLCPVRASPYFFKCPETSLVISNMLTCFLPLNTAFKFSSALIWVRTFLSCNPFLRM